MAKAPAAPAATHYKLRVTAPIFEAGTQFNPGPVYTVKAAVYEKIKAVAVTVTPIVKE